MSWRDSLKPASFRGVPFFYLDTSREGGRRAAVHEFPLRDSAYVEDMGLRNKTFRIEAYVDGDAYMAARDALETALDASGSGTFMHPYKGALTVQVDKYTLKEAHEAGRVAYFSIEFILAGVQPSPTSATDTAGASVATATASTTQVNSSFGSSFATLGHPPSVADAAESLVTQARTAVSSLLATPEAYLTDARSAFLGIATDVSDADQVASSFTNFYSAFVGDIELSQFVFDNTISSRGADLPKDPSYGLAALAVWGSTLPPPAAGTTPDLVQIATNQAAVVALVQGGAVAALASLYAQTDFTSLQAAETARDQITGFIDSLAEAASDAGDDVAYNAWQMLYAAVTADLTTRGKNLPNVVVYSFAQPMPALALGQRLYRDPSRACELIERNDAPHPLFMPLTIEALSS